MTPKAQCESCNKHPILYRLTCQITGHEFNLCLDCHADAIDQLKQYPVRCACCWAIIKTRVDYRKHFKPAPLLTRYRVTQRRNARTGKTAGWMITDNVGRYCGDFNNHTRAMTMASFNARITARAYQNKFSTQKEHQ